MQDRNKDIKYILDCLGIDWTKIPDPVLENINPSYLIGNHFFYKKNVKNHVDTQIDFVIGHEISIGSNSNTHYNFMKRFVKVDCPKCGQSISGTSGGGSGSEYHVDYHCDKCGTKVSLSGNPEGGFHMKFKEKQ
jgi:predicted RNA-binding Zn-ribbon protein involved in translation (DUF1610 family)